MFYYDDENQLTSVTVSNAWRSEFAYDDIGQLKTANGWESDTITPRQHEQFGYAYDKGWNLNRRTNNALVQTFGVNNLNELTNATRTGNMTVAGNVFTTPTSVTVKDNANAAAAATVYGDNTFARDNVPLLNGNNTFTAIAENAVGRKDTNIITAYLPTPVTYYYDVRGNLTNDGRRVFYYDDENQLTSVTVSNAWRSEFAYDGMMRRRIRKEYTWQSSAWLKTNEVRYVYDGRLVIQEQTVYQQSTNSYPLLVTYTRGNDMSGTREGAGGIGGLLARTANLPHLTPSVWSAFYHADGNGNITAMVNPSGNRVAQYHYDPYGTLLASSGPLAEANLYRFSSKEYHANSGLVYYLYRYYDLNLQRWVNRYPIEEEGGLNLFEFGGNEPISEYDSFGYQAGSGGGGMSKPIIFPQKPIPVFKLPKVKPPKSPTPPKAQLIKPGPLAPPMAQCPKTRAGERLSQEAKDINAENGVKFGCHSCGTKDFGTPSGKPINDHQPPTKLCKPGDAQTIMPHCADCSNAQGGYVRQMAAGASP